jgi:hypothetical protein
MNQQRLPSLTRSLTRIPSRRGVLCGIARAGLALGLSRFPAITEAKKKRGKTRPKKARPNAFGCLEVGDACRNAGQCCSGICEGKKGKRTCRAHGGGTCRPQPGFCLDSTNILLFCNNSTTCVCHRTTADSLYCADTSTLTCAECRKDADCVALGFSPEAACLPVFEGACAGGCESGMVCANPCGYEPPSPETP